MAIGTDTFKHFIPTLWSARLLASLDKNLVFKQMATTEYEGEIKSFGDTVKINSIGEITVKDYDGSDIDSPEELGSAQVTLNIDQAKYFNFQVKDVAKAQANINLLDKSMERAGYALADHVDTKIASLATSDKITNMLGILACFVRMSVSLITLTYFKMVSSKVEQWLTCNFWYLTTWQPKKIQMRLYLQRLLVQRVVLHLLNKSLKQKHTVQRKTSLTLSKACLFMVWKSLTLVS